ncbi:hypothetical protein HPB51_012197 [Rhipicephalus microplus]|uniref:Uncharacterized protein n=1 Tax=Rhipicephalus microplus TaxID=6941 RepID=A0A9J6DGN2_RHIMP|nr:hypothetical protein HPB51_012197 [Rhipicephalus microplus]
MVPKLTVRPSVLRTTSAVTPDSRKWRDGTERRRFTVTATDGTSQDVQAWQGPPLPQHGFGTDEHVSKPGSTRDFYIREPTLVLEAMRKPEDMSNENKAASLQYQHDIIYGRTQQHDAPEPNMNTMNPARPPRPQPPKRQDHVMTYAKAARGQRKQGKSAGTSTSQQQARQEFQEGPQEKSNHAVNIRESTSPSRPTLCAIGHQTRAFKQFSNNFKMG